MASKPFETAAKFKYVRTTITKQNSIHGEVKGGSNSENACHRSVQNCLLIVFYLKKLYIKT